MNTTTLNPTVFLTEEDLAARWQCSRQWLRNQRSAGLGVTVTRFGRSVRYALTDVLAYEAGCRGDAS